MMPMRCTIRLASGPPTRFPTRGSFALVAYRWKSAALVVKVAQLLIPMMKNLTISLLCVEPVAVAGWERTLPAPPASEQHQASIEIAAIMKLTRRIYTVRRAFGILIGAIRTATNQRTIIPMKTPVFIPAAFGMMFGRSAILGDKACNITLLLY